jgi:hypothetical protein
MPCQPYWNLPTGPPGRPWRKSAGISTCTIGWPVAVAVSARGLVGAEAGRAVTMVRSPAAYRPFTKVESSSSDG